MSVELDIRNLKNPKDLERKRSEFFKLLRLRAKLNNDYEQAVNTMIENRQLEITPKAPIEKTTGEKLNDSIEQQQIAFANLCTIMSPEEAKIVLSRLYDGKSLTNLIILNRNWNAIKDGLKGATMITPDYFVNYFTRFKQKMNEEPFGIQLKKEGRIGMTKDTEFYQESDDSFEYRRQKLKRQKEQDIKRKNTQTTLQDTGAQARQVVRNMQKDELKDIGDKAKRIADFTEYYKLNKGARRIQEAFRGRVRRNQSVVARPIGPAAAPPVEPAVARPVAPLVAQVETYSRDELNDMNKQDILEIVKRAPLDTRIQLLRSNGTGKTFKEGLLKEQIIDILLNEAASNLSLPPAMTPSNIEGPSSMRDERGGADERPLNPLLSDDLYVSGEEGGYGLKFKSYGHAKIVKKSHLRRLKTGNGIESLMKEKYKTFGRYVIHIPSLKKSVLNIKYPSWASIASIPQQIIDDELREFIMDLLEHKEMNKRYFQNLKDSNQKLFQKIAFQAQIDDQLGLGLPRTDEEREELKRFELVRGEVIAGQNNPEVIKELKHFIIKFMGEGKLTKKQGYDILSELVVV